MKILNKTITKRCRLDCVMLPIGSSGFSFRYLAVAVLAEYFCNQFNTREMNFTTMTPLRCYGKTSPGSLCPCGMYDFHIKNKA